MAKLPRKKRVFRKRRVVRRKARPSTIAQKYATSIPNIMKVKLKYQDVLQLTELNAGSPVQYYRWVPNDLYDPLYETGGHQAMMRDQWYTLYHWGRCVGFKVKVTIFSTSVSPVHVCMLSKEDSNIQTYVQAVEMKNCKKGVVTSEKPLVLYTRGYVDRFLGNRRGTALSDDMFKQEPGAGLNTKAQCHVHFYFQYFMSSGLANLVAQYEILQYCQFSEPIMQSQS